MNLEKILHPLLREMRIARLRFSLNPQIEEGVVIMAKRKKQRQRKNQLLKRRQ